MPSQQNYHIKHKHTTVQEIIHKTKAETSRYSKLLLARHLQTPDHDPGEDGEEEVGENSRHYIEGGAFSWMFLPLFPYLIHQVSMEKRRRTAEDVGGWLGVDWTTPAFDAPVVDISERPAGEPKAQYLRCFVPK